MKNKLIRALFDSETITIYQAYNNIIADMAVKAQTFISPPFKKERMTWIKPSFLWMMYRSDWATKNGQDSILSIRIKKSGFEWALNHSCLSRYNEGLYMNMENWKSNLIKSPVRIQWDPEKDIFSNNLSYKSIQIGLSGIAVDKYLSDWIVEINDITSYCKYIRHLLDNKKISQAEHLLPKEQIYFLPDYLSKKINSDY